MEEEGEESLRQRDEQREQSGNILENLELLPGEATLVMTENEEAAPSIPAGLLDEASNAASSIGQNEEEECQEPQRKKSKVSEDVCVAQNSDIMEEGNLCTICFDSWTTSGPHRLSALKCGHLFGYACIQYWLTTNALKICPSCKEKVSLKDLRFIYASKVISLDNSDYMRACEERNKAIADLKGANFEINRLQVMVTQYSKQITQLTEENLRLKQNFTSSVTGSTKFKMEQKTREISKEGDSRLIAYNGGEHLVVTVKSTIQLFSQYGVRKIDISNLSIKEYVPLHNEVIRDMKFHPTQTNILLTVSTDKVAKLVNIETNSVTKTFHTDCRLWSCCWDATNGNFFYLGTINGKILVYSMEGEERQGPLEIIQTPNDQSGVISLTSVDQNHYGALPYGGIVFCKVTDCGVLVKLGEAETTEFDTKKINIRANFAHVSYNHNFGHLLISYRNKQRWQNDQHVIFDVAEDETPNTLKVINSKHFEGNTVKFAGFPRMSCVMETKNFGLLIAVYYGSVNKINIYSIETGTVVHRVPMTDNILDLVFIQEKEILVALTSKRLYTFQIISS